MAQSEQFHPLMSRLDGKTYIEPSEFENEIPVVRLNGAGFESESVRETVVAGLRDIGFIFVETPDITPQLAEVYQAYSSLFHLPDGVLSSYAHPEIFFQRGFTPSRQEAGIFCRSLGISDVTLPDDKRGWFTGPDLPADHPLVQAYPGFYPPNIFPVEVPEFEAVTSRLRVGLYEVGRNVLSVLGSHLHKPDGFFDDMITDSATLLRSIHYPEVTEESWENTVWACEHTDINLVTVLPASTREGLWVQTRSGEWIKGMAPEGCSIVQVGDMLQYMTGGEFHSAHHMVMAPNGVGTPERYSSALFVHARSDWEFQYRDVNGDPDPNYPDILAADLLMQRLREIGLA